MGQSISEALAAVVVMIPIRLLPFPLQLLAAIFGLVRLLVQLQECRSPTSPCHHRSR